jgi:phosphatidylinositol-3-phosphatase
MGTGIRPSAIWIVLTALLGAACVGQAGPASARPDGAPAPESTAGPNVAGTALCGSLAGRTVAVHSVVVIVMENHSYRDLVGAPGSAVARGAPYINGTLKTRCGLATNYHSITHPSLPNYIAMAAGTTSGISDDCSSCTASAPSLFGQLTRNRLQWRVYAESMPGLCSSVTAGRYAKRHNPPAYFPAIAADCRRWDVPMGGTDGSFARALRNDNLKPFVMVIPDMCHSTHDCSIATGDAWLARWVPKIAATPSYRSGRTVVLVVWDEGSGGSGGERCLAQPSDESCHMPAFVVSEQTAPGTRSSVLYSHFSLLRTAQSLLGMPRFLGDAAAAHGMRPAFGLR